MSTISLATLANVNVITAGGMGLAGLALGTGPMGMAAMAVGGVLAVTHARAKVNQTANYISNGCGEIYHRIKESVLFVYSAVCGKIYIVIDSTAGWLSHYADQAAWVKNTYKEADADYIAQCSKKLYDSYSMDLSKLYDRPLEGGVASQAYVVDALSAHAIKHCQSVSREEIARWVTLGEHLVRALNSDEMNQVPAGMLLVADPDGKGSIAVESSVYNMRAIMWYLTAHHLRHELSKSTELDGGYAVIQATDLENIVDEFVMHSKFVFPDKNGRLFHFLEHARTQYTDYADVMTQASLLRGNEPVVRNDSHGMQLFALDDASRQLPGGTKRIVLNYLDAAEEGLSERIAFKLERFAHPTFSGQRHEGHESLKWRAAQMLQGASSQIMYYVQGLAAKDMMVPLTRQQKREHRVHKSILEALEQIGSADAAWAYKRKQAYDAMKSISLYQILPYLIFEKGKIADANPDLDILHDLPPAIRDILKKKLYRALRRDIQGEVMSYLNRAHHEIHLPPYSASQDEVDDFWRTQFKKLDDTVLNYLYRAQEELEDAERRHQNLLGKAKQLYRDYTGRNLAAKKQAEVNLYKEVANLMSPQDILRIGFPDNDEAEVNDESLDNEPLEIDLKAFLEMSEGAEVSDDDGEFPKEGDISDRPLETSLKKLLEMSEEAEVSDDDDESLIDYEPWDITDKEKVQEIDEEAEISDADKAIDKFEDASDDLAKFGISPENLLPVSQFVENQSSWHLLNRA